MTAFDILFNPLRAEHPFGKFLMIITHHFDILAEDWSPREISKFQACMLMYGKNFGQYREHVSLIKFKILKIKNQFDFKRNFKFNLILINLAEKQKLNRNPGFLS